MASRAFWPVVVGIAGFIVAGCAVTFDGPPDGKQTSKKKVRVEFTLCKEQGGVCDPYNASQDYSLLIGFRVPKGTKPPQSFESTSGLPIELTRNSSYKRELNSKAPRGNKQKWFGYQSGVLDLTAEDEASFEVRMKLPRDFAHKRFKVRPVAGVTLAETTDIDCGSDVYGEGGGDTNAFCIYAPPESEINDNLKIKIKRKKD